MTAADPAGLVDSRSIAVPLKSFLAGRYRLEIFVRDKVAGASVTRNLFFNVLE